MYSIDTSSKAIIVINIPLLLLLNSLSIFSTFEGSPSKMAAQIPDEPFVHVVGGGFNPLDEMECEMFLYDDEVRFTDRDAYRILEVTPAQWKLVHKV